ncbi:MAG TPA: flagellar basal body P-ring protein FlgI [Phycisphaerales bacterium]|nr:flagellar basal body P-ring protein FlgI [Phycisphaerales bacterium]
MHAVKTMFLISLSAAVLALGANTASATSVQDLVRIKGHERNILTGMGIVIGLDGTGDKSKDSLVAARPYAELLRNLGNPIGSIDELARADSYALVQVTMEVPATGVREGDRLDVHVEAMFNAKSLAGGRLVVSMLRPPMPDSPDLVPLAYASGPVVIEGSAMNGRNPRAGVIRQGGQMLADIRTNPITRAGTMTLVLKDQYAGYPVASTIAAAINDEFVLDGYSDIARVEDAKNILIVVPPADRDRPAAFIAALMTIPIDPSLIQTEARVVINEKQGIILVTGNVVIGPVGITHQGLSITSITPEPVPDEFNPLIETRRWTGLDTTGQRNRNSTQLLDLLRALDQLAVPVRDQIAIIHELKKTGALHAQVVVN